MVSMIAQCFSMLGTQIYRTEDGPRYVKGHIICLVFLTLAASSAALLRFLLDRENKQRDQIHGVPETTDMSSLEIDGVYDKHPQFRYAL